MGNLLRSDLKRIYKDKLLLIIVVIAAAFAVITPLLYWVLFKALDPTAMELAGLGADAKSLFFTAFNIGNDLGLVAPILIAVILYKDFSHGTIRNKIISGCSRTSIFFSTYLSGFVALFEVTLLYAFITLGVSLIFFPYQTEPFGWKDFGYLLGSLALEVNLYLFVAALVSYICVSSRNMGFVILKYLGVVMGISLVTGILSGAIMAIQMLGGQETLLKVLEVIQNINIYNYVMVIGKGTSYETKELLFMIATPPVLTAILIWLGHHKMCTKDIK